MTAQCAPYMGARNIFGTPWLRPRLLLPKFIVGFCSDWPYEWLNVHTKFKVRSFTRSWDNMGYPKNWTVPGYVHAPSFPKFLMAFSRSLAMHTRSTPSKTLFAYHTDYLSMCTRFPAIFDCSFEWGLRTPNLGEGETIGDREWYRSKEHRSVPIGRP